MKSILFFLTLWASCSPCFSQQAPTVGEALTAIGRKNYVRALEILNDDLKSLAGNDAAFPEDELLLHRARVLFFTEGFTKAVEDCEDLLNRFPESVWRSKGKLLKAQSLAGSRKFEEALSIYQTSAADLFAEGRKDAIAGELMSFAEMFARSPDPGKLDEPAADYGKALALYQQVLQMESSDTVKEQAQFRMFQLFGILKQWPQVSSSALAYLSDFDPDWRGEFGSLERMTRQKNPGAKLPGAHRFHVRYLHGEALHRQNRRELSVKYLRELDDLIGADKSE
ncbi:hypothetical protein V2O64_03385 [Verrucomicrobiaceae bacterium 227]